MWNSSFLGRSSYAVLPYTQALSKFPAHIQQVAMESLGKQVSLQVRLPSLSFWYWGWLCARPAGGHRVAGLLG